MDTFGIVLLILVGLGAFWAVMALLRQGHPEDSTERDLPENPGPTGEEYPPGSRPAGPGAERMIANPSETEDGAGVDGNQ